MNIYVNNMGVCVTYAILENLMNTHTHNIKEKFHEK
jgi:hypothetical protein